MPGQAFHIFLVVALLLGLAGLALMHVRGKAAFTGKQRSLYVALEAGLLLGVGVALGLPAVLLGVMVSFLTFFTYLQLGRLQYCDSCERTVPRLRPLSEPEFCIRCGASLRP